MSLHSNSLQCNNSLRNPLSGSHYYSLFIHSFTANKPSPPSSGPHPLPLVSRLPPSLYDNDQIGTFLLYRSLRRPLEVHVRQWECGSVVLAASCVCGIVARDGGDVIALDMCDGEMGETKPRLTVKDRHLGKSGVRITQSYQGRKVTVGGRRSIGQLILSADICVFYMHRHQPFFSHRFSLFLF